MGDLAYKAKVLRRVGILRAQNPFRLAKGVKKLAQWGPGFPAVLGMAAARKPNQLAIIDDGGELTWAEVKDEVNRLTQAFKDRGFVPGDPIAVLCRNHRYMVLAMMAVMHFGGRLLLLNTMASASQLNELAEREGAKMLILDQEFLDVAADLDPETLLIAWVDDNSHGLLTMGEFSRDKSTADHPKPAKPSSVVIFTSGTTGLPKGARRKEPENLNPLLSYFGAVPYEGNSVVVLAAPLFHSWGLLNFAFGMSTVPTFVLRRKFLPEQVIRDVAKYKAKVLIVVPVMIQRLADVDPEVIAANDVSSLQITAASGSALGGDLAIRFMDRFTDSIYNAYGATEAGVAAIAGPADLRAAPGTAGRPPWHTVVKIHDDEGREMPQGETGTIFVSNELMFDGYTDGRTKDFRDGMMHTGDLGYFDEEGRLFIAGRDDDMIISGGENVFPRELEDALIDHPDISDVAVTGIDHPEWGQSLAAHVVLHENKTMTADDVVAYAREHVARFAVPQAVQFLDELPRNPTGKVMKRKLPPITL